MFPELTAMNEFFLDLLLFSAVGGAAGILAMSIASWLAMLILGPVVRRVYERED